MSNGKAPDVGRREFLRAGGLTTVVALSTQSAHSAAQAPHPNADEPKPLPRRKLGKTGVEVTIINQGTMRSSGLDRLLRIGYESGIRVFDTAAFYRTEPNFKRWFTERPEVRKEIFLVSKTVARSVDHFVAELDQRLELAGTDHLDLYFWHALGDHREDIDFAKSAEFGKAVEAIKKSGKAKFVGFSTHHVRRAEYIQAAAEGGYIDAIMLQYSPFLDKESPLNRAIDAAHKKDIGLISMKQLAGQFGGDRRMPTPVQEAVTRLAPVLKERNLTPHQGLLQAIWNDERIAMSCISMANTDQLRDNVAAARQYTTLKAAELEQIKAAALAAAPTFCPDCDGRCAAAAGTKARLGDLTRFLTYHEHHGYRAEAIRQYAGLTETERDWSGADLEAAREACPSRLDFATLLPKGDRLLG
jgi:aryl-alcohol dehydrogenase-like predicted oxidoreductase